MHVYIEVGLLTIDLFVISVINVTVGKATISFDFSFRRTWAATAKWTPPSIQITAASATGTTRPAGRFGGRSTLST